MAARAEGWAALRDGLGPAWFFVGAASVAGFWTVHEPGAPWATVLSGRAAGFLALAALASLWASDGSVRYVLDADPAWLRQTMRFAWAVLLVLAVPVAWARHLLEPGGAVAVAAGHLWLSALAVMCAGLLWFHDAAGRDAGRRFYLAAAATAAALAVWGVQAGIMGGPTDPSALLVAWPVAFLLLGASWLGARVAGPSGAGAESAAPAGVPARPVAARNAVAAGPTAAGAAVPGRGDIRDEDATAPASPEAGPGGKARAPPTPPRAPDGAGRP